MSLGEDNSWKKPEAKNPRDPSVAYHLFQDLKYFVSIIVLCVQGKCGLNFTRVLHKPLNTFRFLTAWAETFYATSLDNPTPFFNPQNHELVPLSLISGLSVRKSRMSPSLHSSAYNNSKSDLFRANV